MSSPFPGMDPYLEHPEVWPGVHLLLIAALADTLAPQLRPKYSVSVEVRMYETTGEQSLLVGIPDVAVQKTARARASTNVAIAETNTQPMPVRVPMPLTVRQGFLEVREVVTKEVITAIELLSPINKRAGKERKTYENKRPRVLGSSTHLIEIDLLRSYSTMPVYGEGSGESNGENIKSDYRILVSQSDLRPQAALYAFGVKDQVPSFHLPLQSSDTAPVVNVQQLLNDIYDRSGYDLKLDYTQEPVPALVGPDAAWLDSLLKEKGLR
ncbi:MAG: DUF4058 family protein [Cyanobacteria bacterium J06598_3]